MKTINPHITLVGAGPGDPELLTIKGALALEKADVVLYDALVSEELLEIASGAKKIYVGKRKGIKAFSQDEINRLIVQEAIDNGNVVRLKGGDSFVFGRGSEEIQFAQRFGIPVDVIPGISSSISVPALAGIPVTHRGISNSFHVITAVLANGVLNPEIFNATSYPGTVVILMGLGKLDEITAIFEDHGKGSVAAAVISNGSLANQRSVAGTVSDISEKVKNESIPAPAVIVIGEVVSLDLRTKILKQQSIFSKN